MKLCVLPNIFAVGSNPRDYVDKEIERLKDWALSSCSSVSIVKGMSEGTSLQNPIMLSSRSITYSTRNIHFRDIYPEDSKSIAKVLDMDFICTEEQNKWVLPGDGHIDLIDTDIWVVFLSIKHENSILHPIFPMRPVFVFVIDENYDFGDEIKGDSILQHASRVFVRSEQMKRSLSMYTPLTKSLIHDKRAFESDSKSLTESPWFCPNYIDARTVEGAMDI